MTYKEWIQEHYPTINDALGDCHRAVLRMCEAFPELTATAGWINGTEHWWCVTPTGEIVDPTIVQYTSRGAVDFSYKTFKPGDEVRVGRCMDCGSDIYKRVQTLDGTRETFCDEDCEKSYIAYLEMDIR